MAVRAASAFTLSELGGKGEGSQEQDSTFGFCAGKRGGGQRRHVCLAQSKPSVSVAVRDAGRVSGRKQVLAVVASGEAQLG